MRCNACWRELEGQAITTTCGHILCKEDACRILSNDGACPICDQVLSKSHMRSIDVNPGDDWTNMAMAGVSPQIVMKSAFRGVMFYVGQRELEMKLRMDKLKGQCLQTCESMKEQFAEQHEQVRTAYQKMAKKCQIMEQEIESLSKDKQELQEKYAEKSRQKRKLDEMYDQLRGEYESVKRSAIQPADNFLPRAEPDIFSNMGNMMDARDPMRQGKREGMWPTAARQKSPFDLSTGSPTKMQVPVDTGTRRPSRPMFGTGIGNPSATLRNLIISPMKRPQLSRGRPNLFTL